MKKPHETPEGFLPLRNVIALVETEISAASKVLSQRRDEPGFVLGECTFSIALELAIDGTSTVARLPSVLAGEDVPAERLSRLSVTLRPGIVLEPPRRPQADPPKKKSPPKAPEGSAIGRIRET